MHRSLVNNFRFLSGHLFTGSLINFHTDTMTKRHDEMYWPIRRFYPHLRLDLLPKIRVMIE